MNYPIANELGGYVAMQYGVLKLQFSLGLSVIFITFKYYYQRKERV